MNEINMLILTDINILYIACMNLSYVGLSGGAGLEFSRGI